MRRIFMAALAAVLAWAFFQDMAAEGRLSIKTKRPLIAADDEVEANPRSRSAKLRVAERVG